MNIQNIKNLHSAHTVFICFVFISEQTATSAPVLVGFYNGDERSVRATNWVFNP
jgi:hypothetical protein